MFDSSIRTVVRLMKKIGWKTGILLLLLMGILAFCNLYINAYSRQYLYEDVRVLPSNEYGLILGTSKYLMDGGLNQYFKGRIESTVRLYKCHRIRKIIVSGYKESRYYNEPAVIRRELMKQQIPDSAIILDNAGTRTICSINNISHIVASGRVTIISQKFHNQRAVYLAKMKGIQMIGFNVPDSNALDNIQTTLREVFAKTLAFFEVRF